MTSDKNATETTETTGKAKTANACPKCSTASPKQVGKEFKTHRYVKCKKCGFTWPVK